MFITQKKITVWEDICDPNMINLVACYLNVYDGMERKTTMSYCQARCHSECGVAMTSIVISVKVKYSYNHEFIIN